ncbi:hypothetical protein BaOVIS_007160 [Babesia ovis]|uniref:Uncharacterized protein n=1 Tax=Babesia ovis TaxID=5869 RepID=A0A9W5TBA9_BABOV|nr:hypothetical protein BaOVIS_007160 [Babesia ovis]
MATSGLQMGSMGSNTQQENNMSCANSYDTRQGLEGPVYSNSTEIYVDGIGTDPFNRVQSCFAQDRIATPREHLNIAQLAGARGSFILNQIADPKESVVHYGPAKHGCIFAYNRVQKPGQFGFQGECDFYLPPGGHNELSQSGLVYNDWNTRDYGLYHENRVCGNDSVNSTVDGDSVEDLDDLVGPDGTLPPANKRDPIYTAISGLKWKAKSKKWVVRWDNPITNRRVYKYFSGVRYGFMGAHKRAKYYLEFLNASVGRLDTPSVGNPFCRRTEGPPKGKANKGLIRKLLSRNRPDIMFKPSQGIGLRKGCQIPFSERSITHHLTTVTSTKYRQCNVASKTKADESSADGSSKNGDSAIVTEEPTSTKVTLSPNGFTFKRRYTGNKRLTPKMLKGPLTIADVIRRRMIPQPPSLKETQKVLERKPWKRLGIPKLIKQEKERIEETDEFLDNYFYTYLANRGTDSGLSCGVKNIDQSLFKRKSKATENNQSIVNSADESANGYNVDELLKMWDTKGGHFYTNIPKTVAMLQIVWRMANQSKADKETIKRIGEHVCFHRLVGSVVRHMRYMSRIELPKHLKNYKKLVDMVPRFNKEQMVTIFTVLAYFEFKDERVVNAMLKYTEQYHDITPDELRTIILSCLKMKVDPSHMMEDYITKVKVEHKENSGPERGEVEKLEYYLEVLRTCSILDYMDNELFTHIAEMFKKVENIPLVVVTKAVWLFTNVQHLDEELYQHLYSILIRHLKEIKGKRIVSTLIIWLGCCHYKPPRELVDHLGKMLLSDIESYNLWELTSAIRNLTLMDCYNDDLYKHVLNMELFMKPPSVKVLQQINLQLNQEKSAYAAYLHPTASSDLSVAFSKLYQSYLGYQYLSSSPNKIQLPKDAQNKLKDIHVAGAKNGALTSSAFHIQVKDILKEAFGIDCKVDYITEDGFVVDIAILPSSLAKHTTGINAKDFLIDKKLAIELHGPYHYLQKSTGQFPPPLNNSVLYKTRYVKLPNDRSGLELVKGAFLGFRRHSMNRFIKALELHGNTVFEWMRLGNSESSYTSNLDNILQIYVGRMSLDQLFALYQFNLKCITSNSETKYSLIEAISQNIVKYMREVTSHDTVGNFLDSKKGILRTRQSRCNTYMCNFLFQHRGDLVKYRAEVVHGVQSPCDDHGSIVTFREKRVTECNHICHHGGETDGIRNIECETLVDINIDKDEGSFNASEHKETTGTLGSELPKAKDNSNFRLISTTSNPNIPLIRAETKSEDCLISTNVIALVFSHIFRIKYWQRGFPFNTWINQYFVHNADLYHPIFARLYMSHVVALVERNTNPVDLCVLCDLVKEDFVAYMENNIPIEQIVAIRLYGYCHETEFDLPEVVELFSTVKRLAQHTNFKKLYPHVVKMLTDIIIKAPVDVKIVNTVANICQRNDVIGGVERLLQVLETHMMSNIDNVTCMDICGLLQALYKHNLHSQDLVDAIAEKLDDDEIDERNISTIALSIQTLGRMQASCKSTGFLYKIAEMFVENPHRFNELSESNCSGILWGFYKLHFKHSRFLDVALKRYSSKDLGTPNVNSLVISFSALTRFDSFSNPSVLVDIYRLILKNIASMTISTSQQLITCVTRMLDNITLCCSDQKTYKSLRLLSNKLINATMKHVCERLMDQISTVQAGAMLNALYRSGQRTPGIVAPLIASIAGAYRKGHDWQSSQHMPRKSIYAYEEMPPCPFDVEICAKRLEKVEVTHLVGICEAIHGLDYWSPYSLHLMLQIQRHIEPQLHDMKATHILASCISFVNWPFTDIQMEGMGLKNMETDRSSKEDILQMVKTLVDYDIEKLSEKSESWFDSSTPYFLKNVDVMEHFKMMLMRSHWKEDFMLRCIESLHRHSNFLSAASLPLRRLKMVYDMLRFNIYLNGNSKHSIHLPVYSNSFASNKSPFLILEHMAPNQPPHIATAMPYNLTEFLTQLYGISRTESFHNFIFGESDAPFSVVNGNEDDEDLSMESAACSDLLQRGKEIPTIRPLYTAYSRDEAELDVSTSCYHKHQGSGAIFQVADKYIYVDPVIGGVRTTLLLLDSKRHYLPHLVENIYR